MKSILEYIKKEVSKENLIINQDGEILDIFITHPIIKDKELSLIIAKDKIGLGVLLGLENWRTDSFFNALHLDYLQKTYWQTKYTVSFPRLRPAEGVIKPNFIMDDKDLTQLICAYRLWNEDLEISLSTRENERFRNNIIPLGITSMSSGSKTNPGGYVVDPQSLEQFEISDERSASEIAILISSLGYEPVWKDWDKTFSQQSKVESLKENSILN